MYFVFLKTKKRAKKSSLFPRMRSCVIVRPPRAAAARGVVLKRAEEKSSKRVFWAQKPWSSFTSSSFWVRASRARDQSPLLRQSRRRQSLFERRFQNCEMEKGTARFVKHISAQREEEKEGHTKPHQLTNKINEKRTSFLRARERPSLVPVLVVLELRPAFHDHAAEARVDARGCFRLDVVRGRRHDDDDVFGSRIVVRFLKWLIIC